MHASTGNLSSRSFLRFLLVGGGATLLQYLIMAALMALCEVPAVRASTIGFLLSAIFNYWANARFTFAAQGGHRRSILRFAVTLCAGLAINALVLYAFKKMGAAIWLAQLIATGVVLVWNYTINAIWTFRKRHSS